MNWRDLNPLFDYTVHNNPLLNNEYTFKSFEQTLQWRKNLSVMKKTFISIQDKQWSDKKYVIM